MRPHLAAFRRCPGLLASEITWSIFKFSLSVGFVLKDTNMIGSPSYPQPQEKLNICLKVPWQAVLCLFRENEPTFFHSLMWPNRTIHQQSQCNGYFETAGMISPSSGLKSKKNPKVLLGPTLSSCNSSLCSVGSLENSTAVNILGQVHSQLLWDESRVWGFLVKGSVLQSALQLLPQCSYSPKGQNSTHDCGPLTPALSHSVRQDSQAGELKMFSSFIVPGHRFSCRDPPALKTRKYSSYKNWKGTCLCPKLKLKSRIITILLPEEHFKNAKIECFHCVPSSCSR